MKIVIPGGTGQVGTILSRALTVAGPEVLSLDQAAGRCCEVGWDGNSLGPQPSTAASRRVVPGRLLGAGFTFGQPHWPQAAADLVSRVRARP